MASMEAAWQRLTAAISRLEAACGHVEQIRRTSTRSQSPTAAEAIAAAERRVADISDELAEARRERDRLARALAALEEEKDQIVARSDRQRSGWHKRLAVWKGC